jgi:hypothetical protein
MKTIFKILVLIFLSFPSGAQDTLWILREENKPFLNQLDSLLEVRFGKSMELFPIMDAGAENFARCESGVDGCTEEYIYNEAYYHEMLTLSSSINDYVGSRLVSVLSTAGDDSVFASYMYLLQPDKFWVGYYEISGKFLLVVCLSVDREKVYAEMGLKFGGKYTIN